MVQATHYEVVSKVEHDVEDVSDQEDEAEEECNHSNCHTETAVGRAKQWGQWSLRTCSHVISFLMYFLRAKTKTQTKTKTKTPKHLAEVVRGNCRSPARM